MESCTYDIDHNYTGGVNTAEASLSDHSYTVAAESPNAGVIPHDDRSLSLTTVKFFEVSVSPLVSNHSFSPTV